MKQIELSFTPDELRELAKQLYMAGYFLLTCDYDNQRMVDDIYERICATGFSEAAETGAFTHGGKGETLFTISRDVDDECTPVIDLYGDDVIRERLPDELASRDLTEQYGVATDEEVVCNPVFFNALMALQNKYKKEFETYGITHLRLQEKE